MVEVASCQCVIQVNISFCVQVPNGSLALLLGYQKDPGSLEDLMLYLIIGTYTFYNESISLRCCQTEVEYQAI